MLFYAYPGFMPQAPVFNSSWPVIFSDLIAALSTANRCSCKLLCAKRFLPAVEAKLLPDQIACVDEVALHREVAHADPACSGASALFQSARAADDGSSLPVQILLRHLGQAVRDFEPGIILTFAASAEYLKSLWPNARIIYVEAGAFSRPPFPASLIFDPAGIYNESPFARAGKSLAQTTQAEPRMLAARFRDAALNKIRQQSPFGANGFERKFEKLVLLPLEVSNSDSLDGQSPYRSRFEYLFDIAAQTPREIGLIVTEDERWGEVLTELPPQGNLTFIAEKFPNLILDARFRKYAHSSQFLVPMVDGVWSVSSPVGVQAALFGKHLGSPRAARNAPLADALSPAEFFAMLGTAPPDRTAELAWYLFHYAVPDTLFHDGEWLFDYLTSLKARGQAGRQPLGAADRIASAWLDGLTDRGPVEWRSANATHSRQLCEKDLQLARTEGGAAAGSQHLRKCSRTGRASFILLNDTRQINNFLHLGCNAVTHFIIEQAAEMGLAWHGSASTLAECQKLVGDDGFENVSLIIFNGEGSMHHDSPRCVELMKFCKAMKERGIPSVLVNSVWHANTDVLGEYLDIFNVVSVRETHSLKEIRQFREDAVLVPDFSFAAYRKSAQHFDSASFCKSGGAGRKSESPEVCVIDSVRADIAEQLREFAEINSFPFFLMGDGQAAFTAQERTVFTVADMRYPRILRDCSELAGAKICVTGRFHGLIAALLNNTPVFALPSNTPKVEGLLTDMGIGGLALLDLDWLELPNAGRIDDLKARASRWNAGAAERVAAFAAAAETEIRQLFKEFDLADTFTPKKMRWVNRIRQALSYTTPAMRW